MIDHEIDWHEWLDNFWITAELLHCAPHRGKIDHQRNAGEILENNARYYEWNLFVGRLLRIPFGQRLYIAAANFLAVAVAQHRFEDNPNADRQPRNVSDALFFERGQRMQKSFAAVAGVEFL